MPVVLRIVLTFSSYSLENNEPPHIHIRRDRAQAKFWLIAVSVAYNGGYARYEVRHLARLVEEHQELLLRSWHDSFESTSDRVHCDAMYVTFDEFMLSVRLADGREIDARFEYFPRLRDATPEQLARWEIIGNTATAFTGRNSMRTSQCTASSACTKLARE